MKNIVYFVVVFFAVLTNSCSQMGGISQNSLFRTPEAVMKYFVLNIKNADFDNALKTSVYNHDEAVKIVNVKQRLLSFGGIIASETFNLPAQYHSITKLKGLYRHAINIQFFVSSLLLPKQFDDFPENRRDIPLLNDEQLLDSYLSSLENIKKLSSLEFVRMDIALPDEQFGDRGKSYMENSKKSDGFDESIEYTVLFKFDNDFYAGVYIFNRYGNNWYIWSYTGRIINQNIYGSLEKLSGIEEYKYKYDIK